jgi:hypothetical protein
LPVSIGSSASQYGDEPSLTRTRTGPGTGGSSTRLIVTGTIPANGSAIRANAGGARSTCPASHSGHWSATVTRTVPFGPVTSSTVPQAAEPANSAGESATYVPVAAASG